MKKIAIILAAGSGKRMQSQKKKQFLLIDGYPVLYYSIRAFEMSEVDEILLVVGEEDRDYCRDQIVKKFEFQKVRAIITGGKERYDSVYNGLMEIQEECIVLIHDGARPCIDTKLITKCIKGAEAYEACVAGMPVKDTIKIVDEDGWVCSTPKREQIWGIQTPQAFRYSLLRSAYDELIRREISVTDDATAVEYFTNHAVKIIEASYSNIKLTTPEDLYIAERFLLQQKSKKF